MNVGNIYIRHTFQKTPSYIILSRITFLDPTMPEVNPLRLCENFEFEAMFYLKMAVKQPNFFLEIGDHFWKGRIFF